MSAARSVHVMRAVGRVHISWKWCRHSAHILPEDDRDYRVTSTVIIANTTASFLG